MGMVRLFLRPRELRLPRRHYREQLHSIGSALQAFGLNTLPHEDGGDNICYSIEHYDEDGSDDS